MALRSILRAFSVLQGGSAEFQRNTLTESYLRPVTVIASERGAVRGSGNRLRLRASVVRSTILTLRYSPEGSLVSYRFPDPYSKNFLSNILVPYIVV
jgi:hypothetical protein